MADQATAGFRIFTQDPTNPLSANTWTATGPTGEGAKEPGGNAEVAGRINAIAVDPSDPSGNTVFVAAASGRIWKTTNFLTTAASGPSYVPLIENSSAFGLDISGIAFLPRSNTPNQSIIFAATGDGPSTGDPVGTEGLGSRGIGFLRSMDGGQTWTLLDSRDNTVAFASRDHFFSSSIGQTGVTSYKITVDPTPLAGGNVIVYAALSDIDVNGAAVASGPKGGIWRSLDSGNTWSLMLGGQASDVLLDENNPNPTSGNVDTIYAAIRGQGVFISPNRGQTFNLMTGFIGDPLIQNTTPPPSTPVGVGSTDVIAPTPNGDSPSGRIVLAKPAVEPSTVPGYKQYNLTTEGWLYAAVVYGDTTTNEVTNATPLPTVNPNADWIGLYMTKDFGQNWVKVRDFLDNTVSVPSNSPTTSTSTTNQNYPITGEGTPKGAAFHLGNYDLSLAVDADNPNVVYLGGTDEFTGIGLERIDTTGIHDAHSFYLDNNSGATGVGGLQTSSASSGVSLVSATTVAGLIPPYDPYATPFLNLIRDPANPFLSNATILVQNTASFINDGEGTKWIPYDQAIAPDPFSTDPFDPWLVPTRGVQQIVTIQDPLTGKSRQIYATDQGVYTSVDDGTGVLVPSVGNNTIVSGSRNGDLQIAQENQGAVEPSQFAAANSELPGQGFIFATTRTTGIAQSDLNIENKGATGYGDLSYNVEIGDSETGVDRGSAQGLATQQNLPTFNPANPTAPLGVGGPLRLPRQRGPPGGRRPPGHRHLPGQRRGPDQPALPGLRRRQHARPDQLAVPRRLQPRREPAEPARVDHLQPGRRRLRHGQPGPDLGQDRQPRRPRRQQRPGPGLRLARRGRRQRRGQPQ